MNAVNRLTLLLLTGILHLPVLAADKPVVIAHRGASGYVPEHTLLAVTAAHAMGADFIEQDVVLTRDGVPVVLHDIHLDTTTDVAQRFPERARSDGRWYAADFELSEIKQLSVSERTRGDGSPVYPERFPVQDLGLRVPTLEEEINLIDGLNRSTGREAGLYIELKAPVFHRAEGFDIAQTVINVLEQHGRNGADANVILQCFDPETLRRIHDEGMSGLPLIQLIGENDWDPADTTDFDAMRSAEGLQAVAVYADGIGPWIPQLFDADGRPAELVTRAVALGLLIHPYTLRADALAMPVEGFDALQRKVFLEARVDGAFTDFPDLTSRFIDQHFDDRGSPSPGVLLHNEESKP